MTETKTVGLDDIDLKLTKDWVDICVGRYSLKVPPQLATPTGLTNYFDDFELKVLKNHTKESFDKLVLDKKRYIDRLPAPKELETAFHREHEDKNTYLVAYRSGVRKDKPLFNFPDHLDIYGYKLVKTNILVVKTETIDGYKQKQDARELNDFFENRYANALRILNLAKPVKRTLLLGKPKPGPGFCIDNAVVIAGKPVTKRYYMAGYSESKNKLYRLSVKIDFFERQGETKPVYKSFPNGDVRFLNTNNITGSYLRRFKGLNKYIEYRWITEDWNSEINLDRPVMKINLSGRHQGDYDLLDKVFENIIASLILR